MKVGDPFNAGPISRPVGQSWYFADGSDIRLFQLPGMGMPRTGEVKTLGKLSVEYVLADGEDIYPDRLGIYWQSEDMGYCLHGTLTDSVTQELLESLVLSVTLR